MRQDLAETGFSKPILRSDGFLIGGSTLLALALVAHHPVAANQDPSVLLETIARLRLSDNIVHGGLIGLMLALATGFIGFAANAGLDRPVVRAGLIAYLVGVIATIGAAMIDGFLVPDVAARFISRPVEMAAIGIDLLNFCGLAIQALTKLGLILMSFGIFAWSLSLLRRRGAVRAIGLAGLFVGLVPAIAIIGSRINFNPHLLIGFLLVQAIWNLAVAALMVGKPEALSCVSGRLGARLSD